LGPGRGGGGRELSGWLSYKTTKRGIPFPGSQSRTFGSSTGGSEGVEGTIPRGGKLRGGLQEKLPGRMGKDGALT